MNKEPNNAQALDGGIALLLQIPLHWHAEAEYDFGRKSPCAF